jgi:hypothetical protein
MYREQVTAFDGSLIQKAKCFFAFILVEQFGDFPCGAVREDGPEQAQRNECWAAVAGSPGGVCIFSRRNEMNAGQPSPACHGCVVFSTGATQWSNGDDVAKSRCLTTPALESRQMHKPAMGGMAH